VTWICQLKVPLCHHCRSQQQICSCLNLAKIYVGFITIRCYQHRGQLPQIRLKNAARARLGWIYQKRPDAGPAGAEIWCIPIRDVVPVSTSRSRDGLKTYQRLVSVSSRPKCPTSRSRLGLGLVRLGSRLGLDPKRLGSRGGSRTISSRQDVSCRRAQLNYNSPMKTSRPMPYSVGRVLGTICLDGLDIV